jgi:hypothetical protein
MKDVSVAQQQPTAMITKDNVAIKDSSQPTKKGPGEETM